MIGILLMERLKTVTPNVYPVSSPQQGPVPYITITLIASISDYTHKGYSGLEQTTYRINIYSDSFTETKTLAAAVEESLNEWKDGPVSNAMKTAHVENRENETSYNLTTLSYIIRWKN